MTLFLEAIYTANIDFFGEVLRVWTDELAREAAVDPQSDAATVLQALPEWFDPVFGLDDLPDAYRGVPIHEEDGNVAIVAVWDPRFNTWRFAIARAMFFGFSAAVNNFNRKPTLLTAAARRFFGVAATQRAGDGPPTPPDLSVRAGTYGVRGFELVVSQ